MQTISPSTPIPQSLAQIEKILSEGEFLAAAHIAAGTLTSPALDPTDIKTVANLLSVRYSCLELTGNTLVAAQESKALEDLNSEFYYILPPPASFQQPHPKTTSSLPSHILPFRLRLQASRLQSIGFSDPRRGVSALYDLGLECREHIVSAETSPSERDLWERRLAEVGVRVVNALIEVNDLECAKRTLRDLRTSKDVGWKLRMGLLLIKVGDLRAAQELLEDSSETLPMLVPLLATAEGRFKDAVREWEYLRTQTREKILGSIIQQNLAVNLLYAGRLKNARQLMEDAVENGDGYGSLTFNLATLYELSSERSRDLKANLASRVASQDWSTLNGNSRLNADFKL